MATIKISTHRLRSTADEFRKMNKTLDDDLRRINDTMQGLAPKWKSDTSDTIRKKMAGMEETFNHFRDVVEQYAKFLEAAAESYESTESAANANASEFK